MLWLHARRHTPATGAHLCSKATSHPETAMSTTALMFIACLCILAGLLVTVLCVEQTLRDAP